MRILSWGSNSHGQLGQGTVSEQTINPTQIDLTAEAKLVIGGGKHTIFLSTTHEVFSCGDNNKGQLGQELVKESLTFQKVLCQIQITKVSCGWDFNLALSKEGEVFGWGSNAFGQLGLPLKQTGYLPIPTRISKLKAHDIACGLRHSAVVDHNGHLYTSGSGRKGQLGILVNEQIPKLLDCFQKVLLPCTASKVACGENHCLAYAENSQFLAWGDNKFGQLGIDPALHLKSAEPLNISLDIGLSKVISLSCGWTHNVILTDNGNLITWGRNDYGQLGENRANSWKPEIIRNFKKIKQCVVGSHHCLALTENNAIFSWGWNEHGNCGNGTLENVFQPTEIKIKGFKPVLIGSGAAHCFAIGE